MVFIDSNVWVAYLNKEDKFHQHALRVLSSIKKMESVFVTTGIVHEVVNYFFKLKGKEKAEEYLSFFLNAPNTEIIIVDELLWQKTINLFKKYSISLTDAQIIAAMQQKQDKIIYSFDRHFDQVKEIKRIH